MTNTFRTSTTTLLAAAAALALSSAAGSAADLVRKSMPEIVEAPTSVPFDLAFGIKALTDYNFRGISQTDRKPAIQGYIEAQFLDNLFYAGVFASNVDLITDPDAEIDFYGGIRPKFGPLSFDFGVIGYYYPGEQRYFDAPGNYLSPANTDFAEVVGKVAYTYENFTVGGNVFYAWDWLGSGAEATYASVTGKVGLPFLEGLSVSAELGHYWLGTTSPQLGAFDLPDYVYWNAGVSYNYKNVTLDLRYHDTDLSKTECFANTTDPSGIVSGSGRSKWCDATFVASLAFDITASSLGIFAPK